MNFSEDPNYAAIAQLFHDFETEIKVHKTILEESINRKETYNPMFLFLSSPHTKEYIIVTPFKDSFPKLLSSISEVMHYFSASNSYSAVISLVSKASIDDEMYETITFFIVSKNDAYIYYLPYRIENNTITWYDDIAFSQELAETQLDEHGLEIINIIHSHVQTDRAPFSDAEILNYLSYTGCAIQPLNPDNVVSYINMAGFTFETPQNVST